MRLAAFPLARHAHAAAQRPQMEMTVIAPVQRGSLAENAVFFDITAMIDRHTPSSFSRVYVLTSNEQLAISN